MACRIMEFMTSPTGLRVAAYDPDWPRQAAATMTNLRSAVPGWFIELEHIGSTSVPGLAAKPIIDLMAAIVQLEAPRHHQEALGKLNFHPHQNGMTDRLLYVRTRHGVRTDILHVVTLKSWPTRNQRILRDYLRSHPAEAARYGEFKRAILATGVPAGGYSRAKTELVQELTDRARAELGLPPVPVWEKEQALPPSNPAMRSVGNQQVSRVVRRGNR